MKNPNANLKGMLRLIPASKNALAPVFEAVTNSLESILEKDSGQEECIEVHLFFNDIDNNNKALEHIVVIDTGAGFNASSYKRFNELLDSSKGYHNRGSGRLQFLHRFVEVHIDSSYIENGEPLRRSFKCSKESFNYDETYEPSDDFQSKTMVHMKLFKGNKKDICYFHSLSLKTFSSIIKSQYALRAYLEREKGLIFPKLILNFHYEVSSNSEQEIIGANDFPPPCSSGSFSVPYCYPKQAETTKSGIDWVCDSTKDAEVFNWLAFEFDDDSIESHGAFLCSKDIPVESINNALVQGSKGLNGKKKVTAIYGNYLDLAENVNDAVDSFVITSKSEVKQISSNLFGDDSYVYLDDIKKEASYQLSQIYGELFEAKEQTSRRVNLIAKQEGVSQKIADIVKSKIAVNASDDKITDALHDALAKFIAKKSKKVRNVVKQLEQLDPTSSSYKQEMETKAKELSALVDEQNKEELSKYVVRRELVVSLLEKVVSKQLVVQNTELPKGKRQDKEGIIHDLFFKRKTSSNAEFNDLWILDEEFLHYQGFSELEMNKMRLPNGLSLLNSAAFDEMQALGFKKNLRPDVFLYAGEGKCVLLEFKAQDVDLSDYLQQMPKYCNVLANYANVKIERFYCYLIGENISPISSLNEYERSVTGSWYRDPIPVKNIDINNRQTIANIRMEIMTLSELSQRARVRNLSFARKLGLEDMLSNPNLEC